MSILQDARAMRSVIEQAAQSLDDKTASTAPALLRQLRQDGKLVSAETRINWGGTVKRAVVDLWDTAENTPDAAPTLWEDINYRDGIRVIPTIRSCGGPVLHPGRRDVPVPSQHRPAGVQRPERAGWPVCGGY